MIKRLGHIQSWSLLYTCCQQSPVILSVSRKSYVFCDGQQVSKTMRHERGQKSSAREWQVRRDMWQLYQSQCWESCVDVYSIQTYYIMRPRHCIRGYKITFLKSSHARQLQVCVVIPCKSSSPTQNKPSSIGIYLSGALESWCGRPASLLYLLFSHLYGGLKASPNYMLLLAALHFFFSFYVSLQYSSPLWLMLTGRSSRAQTAFFQQACHY